MSSTWLLVPIVMVGLPLVLFGPILVEVIARRDSRTRYDEARKRLR